MLILDGEPEGLEFGRDLAWVMGRIVTARHLGYPASGGESGDDSERTVPASQEYESGGKPPHSKWSYP
jgi:hypothetical protein